MTREEAALLPRSGGMTYGDIARLMRGNEKTVSRQTKGTK